MLVQEGIGSQAQYGVDAADDVLAFTTGAPPGQPGAIGDLLWGCRSQVFPALLRPPGCA